MPKTEKEDHDKTTAGKPSYIYIYISKNVWQHNALPSMIAYVYKDPIVLDSVQTDRL